MMRISYRMMKESKQNKRYSVFDGLTAYIKRMYYKYV